MAVRFDPRTGNYVKAPKYPVRKPVARLHRRGCPRYTVDQGCPLHGEGCAEGK
jgi:hypothetical protein